MKNLTYKDNKIYLNECEITFGENVYQIKQDNDKIYILLDIPPKEELMYDDFHNVYCYSTDGLKMWQIGVRPKGDKAVYTMINLDGIYLYANDFLGRKYTVDKSSGKIRDMTIAK